MTDPRKENSREARERSLPKAGSDKAKILEAFMVVKSNSMLLQKYPDAILSPWQIATIADMDYHAVQRRMSDLVRDERVKIVGKKDGYTLYEAK